MVGKIDVYCIPMTNRLDGEGAFAMPSVDAEEIVHTMIEKSIGSGENEFVFFHKRWGAAAEKFFLAAG